MEIKIGILDKNPLPDFENVPIVGIRTVIIDDEDIKRIGKRYFEILNGPEVVRCKDCKFCLPAEEDEELSEEENQKFADTLRLLSLTGICDRRGVYIKAYDYCSYGEYKEVKNNRDE